MNNQINIEQSDSDTQTAELKSNREAPINDGPTSKQLTPEEQKQY